MLMTSPFVDAMTKQFGQKSQKQYGENGAVEFSHHGVKGSDSRDVEGYLSAAFAGILRNTSPKQLKEYTSLIIKSNDITQDDLEDFFAMIFHTRECRGDGKGERLVTYHLLFAAGEYYENIVLNLLEQIPEYGYWKDFQNILELGYTTYKNTEISQKIIDKIFDIWVLQLREDILSIRTEEEWDTISEQGTTTEETNKFNISLAAKYFPKQGKSLDKKYNVTTAVARKYFNDYNSIKASINKRFRKEVLSPITEKINLTERLMCAKEFKNINFRLVPGKCLSINRKAFLNLNKNNQIRYPSNEDRIECAKNLKEHMENASKGLTKINGKQLFLHEITSKFTTRLSEEEKTLYNLQWNEHYKHYLEQVKNNSGLDQTLVLADFSGSMHGEPMNVAAALALMISSLAPAPWKNKFISFETRPQLLEIPDTERMQEKMNYVMNSPWGGSTDFLAAIQLILDVGINNNLTQEQMPKKLIVVSDMQFNQADRQSSYSYSYNTQYPSLDKYSNGGFGQFTKPSMNELTTHNLIQQAFFNAGMAANGAPWTPPTIVYWNVRDASTQGFQVQSNTPNTQMLAGFSISLLKLVLDNKDTSTLKPPTPYETFLKAVRETEKYEPIREIVRRHMK